MAFTPTSISNCHVWFEADMIAGPPANGAAVSTVTEQSANALVLAQATAGKKPTYTDAAHGQNGHPYINTAAASSQSLDNASSFLTGDLACTVFAVFADADTTSAGSIFGWGTAGTRTGFAVSCNYPAGDKICFFYGNSNTSDFGTGNTASTWRLFSGTKAAGAINTTAAGRRDAKQLTNTGSGAGVLAVTSDGFSIGRFSNTFAGFYFNGKIAAVVVYDRVLSADEIAQVEAYLAIKYGITAAGYVGATLSGTGALVANANAAASATLSGTAALSGPASVAPSATLSSDGVLAGNAGGGLSASLGGTGALVANGNLGLSATLSGDAPLSANGTPSLGGTLSSDGSLAGSLFSGLSATLTSDGSLSAGLGIGLSATLTSDGAIGADLPTVRPLYRRIGGVQFPLAAPAPGGSLLILCDPFAKKSLDFFRSMIIGNCNDALLAAWPGQIVSACPHVMSVNPELFFGHRALQLPLLAMYLHELDYAAQTQRWDRTDQRYRVEYILPPVTADNAHRITPILKAVVQLLVLVTQDESDPSYNGGENFLAATGVQEARWGKATFGLHQIDNGMAPGIYPGFVAELVVKEREAYDARNGVDYHGATATMDVADDTDDTQVTEGLVVVDTSLDLVI